MVASSTGAAAALIKGAFVIHVWAVVLLHSSTGQQPPASALTSSSSSDCANCPSNCTQICQDMAASNARRCNTTYAPSVVYEGCLKDTANSTCKGNSSNGAGGGHGCCTIGTCTPEHCGNPCVQEACKSCTASAYSAYYACMAPVSKTESNCMPGCMGSCRNHFNCGINA